MFYKIASALLLLLAFALAFAAWFDSRMPVAVAQLFMLASIASFIAVAALGIWRGVGLFERYMKQQ